MYQIRKCKRVTSHYASEVATLNPENFRNLSIPYEGDSEEDFFNYIAENSYELEQIYEELDEETVLQLEKLWMPSYEEFYNSESKYEDSWFELGKEDSEYTKNNGFETLIDNINY